MLHCIPIQKWIKAEQEHWEKKILHSILLNIKTHSLAQHFQTVKEQKSA